MSKKSNLYAGQIDPSVYASIPKAVFAAIAVSALTCGGDHLETAQERVLEEWRILHENGIVSQKPRAVTA
jgi:hypothetical protein